MRRLKTKGKKPLSILLAMFMVIQFFPMFALADARVSWSVPEIDAAVGEEYNLMDEVTATTTDGSTLTVEIVRITSTVADYIWNGTDTTVTPSEAGTYTVDYNAVDAEDKVLDTYSRIVAIDKAECIDISADSAAEGEEGSTDINTDSDSEDNAETIQVTPLFINDQGVSEGGTDVSDKITWGTGILQVNIDGVYEIYDPFPLSNSFPASSDYQYVITWEAADLDWLESYEAGDYFTFKVPEEFGGRTLDMVDPDTGLIYGTITIDENGNAKAVFNGNVGQVSDLGGSMSLGGTYTETTIGTPVIWEFEFGGNIYTYTGTADGRDLSTIRETNTLLSKYGYEGQNGAYGQEQYWCITMNQEQSSFDSGVGLVLTDVFGDGYVLDTLHHHDTSACVDCIDNNWGKYAADTEGYTDHAYFEIIVVDWNKIRDDYNAMITSGEISGSLVVAPDISDYMYEEMRWKWDDAANYWAYISYLDPKDDIEYINITENGFEIGFADQALDGKCVEIYYWFEITSLRPLEVVGNTATALDVTTTEEVNLSSNATVNAIKGEPGRLLLFKQSVEEKDSDKMVPLTDANFTLEKEGSTASITVSVNSDGSLEFPIAKENDSYDGTYILTEILAPDGYKTNGLLEITLDADGYIISVNGTAVPTDASYGTEILDADGNLLCWVGRDRLAIIAYNAPGTTVALEAEKTLTGKNLTAGQFEFVLIDNTTNLEVATGTNDINGYIVFDGIEYTYEDIGTHGYTIKEVIGTESGIIYDESVFYAAVNVAESATGGLEATVTYRNGSTVVDGIEFTNSYTLLKVIKVDADDTPLPGAEFILWRRVGGTTEYYCIDGSGNIAWTQDKTDAESLITDVNGFIELEGLDYGSYTLEEITPPMGYVLPNLASHDFTISKEYPLPIITVMNRSAINLNVQKVDADQWEGNVIELLDGAEFILYYIEDGTTYYYNSTGSNKWRTDRADAETLVTVNGTISINDIPSGYIYTLEETKVPAGYNEAQAGRIVYIYVDIFGNITTNEGKDALDEYSSYDDSSKILTVTNSKEAAEFTFRKVDATDTTVTLPDAEFTLYTCTTVTSGHVHDISVLPSSTNCSWVVVDTQTSQSDGLVSFTGLADGEYMLVETKAPSGYQLPTGQWKIMISNGEAGSPAAVGDTMPPAFEQAGDADTDADYLLGNMKPYQLPAAGGGGGWWYALTGSLMILGGGGLALILRRSHRRFSVMKKTAR